ncbi:MAG: insulysin [Psychrobacter glaciei]|jgi:insulysin
MPSRNNTFFIAIILAIAFSIFKGSFMQQPITSANDSKQYRYVELDNGLRALLISDQEADHGAASLDVNVGSLQDPENRAGLAHFLEHMLFLGTKTYPTAGEYQSFISQHGGSHNAFTAAEHTNYFFQVNADQFEGALDRFSRFFHEPLFSEEYVQREKNAVNSEYQSKLKDDYRRMHYAKKAIMNPAHPASRFSTGSLDTLSDNSDSKVRDDLLAFYKRYYSANLMTLTVYGPQDLDTLEQWASDKFSVIENSNATVAVYPAELFLKKPVQLNIQPVKDIYNLSYTFELSDPVKNYKEKSSQYLGHLLGHEGEGTLLAWLKLKGWAEGLSAGLSNKLNNNSAFQVTISLSQDGTEHIDEITEQLFAYVNLIKADGVKAWVFDELKQLGKLHFTFEEGRPPSQLVQSISMSMHDYEIEDILQGPYLWEDYNPEKIQSFASKLNPNNMIRALTMPNVKTDKVEKWFNGPYSTAAFTDKQLNDWSAPTASKELHIPQPNPFIPNDVTVLADNKQTLPVKLEQSHGLDAWHMQDVSFNGPQSSIYISLQSNLPKQSATNQVLIDAWVNLLNDHLNTFSYPAALAGQSYSLYSHMRGIGIRLYGYRDKQDILLEKILTEIKAYKPTEAQWLQTQQELQRAYQNALKQKPYERTIAQLNQLLIVPSYSEAELLAALNTTNLESLLVLQSDYFKQVNTIILGHGNLSDNDVLASSQTLHDVLLNDSQVVDVKQKTLKQIPQGLEIHKVDAQHNDSAFTLYYQAQTKDPKERATLGLLGQIIKAPYYTYMRTERKHGYIVFATPYPILEQGGLGFIVQSPVTPTATLLAESEAFIENFAVTLEAMSEQDFISHRQGLVTNLTKKPLNLQEKTSRLWRDLDRENLNFDTMDKIAQHVAKLSKQEVIDYLKQYIVATDKKAIFLSYDPKR